MLITNLPTGNYLYGIGGGLVSVASIGGAFHSVRAKTHSKNDDGLYKEYYPTHNGEDTLIYKYFNKDGLGSGRTFFDPEQFAALKVNIGK